MRTYHDLDRKKIRIKNINKINKYLIKFIMVITWFITCLLLEHTNDQ